MRNIDSGRYKNSGVSVVECRRYKARQLGKSQIMSFAFVFLFFFLSFICLICGQNIFPKANTENNGTYFKLIGSRQF